MAVRSPQEKSAINRMLMSHQLGRLEEGTGLLAQLGFLVRDHEHLRSLLVRCEPENRSDMYNSLKPYLHFDAQPLDAYIAESARLAEQNQLPTIDKDGDLRWTNHTPQVGTTDSDAAQVAVNQAFAEHTLVLTCRSCTKAETFTGDTKHDAVLNARLAGWVYYEVDGVPREICPECPAIRKVS